MHRVVLDVLCVVVLLTLHIIPCVPTSCQEVFLKPLGSCAASPDGLCVVFLLTLHIIRLWQPVVNTFFEKVIDLYALETP